MIESLTSTNLWFISGVILIILEMFTPGFFLASLSVGTFLAALIAWLGGSETWQLVGFIVGGTASLLALRPVIKRYFEASGASTNADALMGRVSKVEQTVRAGDRASIRIDGDTWEMECDQDLKSGDRVQVVARQSIILIVKRLD